MSGPMHTEDELAHLDFTVQCEITLEDDTRCTRDARILLDIHGHCQSVGRDIAWRRMFLCSHCALVARLSWQSALQRLGRPPACRVCDESFPTLSSIMPFARLL